MLLKLAPFLFMLAAPQAAELLRKGLVEMQHGDLQAARSDLLSASQLDSKNAYIFSALAEVYVRTRELDAAASAARQAEKIGAGNPVVDHALAMYYSQIGDWARAAKAEERYSASPQADALAKDRAAGWYLAAGDEAKALALGKEAARGDSQATFELAQLLLREQQFVDAAELLQDGLDAHPNDAQLTLALGVARYGERRFEDAIKAFLVVIHLDPGIEQPYEFLGRMLDQAGPHLDEITALTREWATKNPGKAEAQLLLAKALLAHDPSDASAEPLLRRSIAIDGNSWEAHYQLGLFLEGGHKYLQAAEQLLRATQLNPDQPDPHYHLARVYDRMGNAEAAAREREAHKLLLETGKVH